ncbi:DUF2975 domain-containing protein [Ornithinibacillus halotolerans]|uniref:DUF2975 domain-containing protein n=1 Tax=Ornithinibacillus halotolerans TaxID=1274357 RepID=A0A916W4P7_9BACI|nr:DUF2975 domain-containing protein [Ornithinibacillus halotolerans]GGA67594.1 hypothetical protein GCM10008025_09290 [Ornithinibacillus halotolerans]
MKRGSTLFLKLALVIIAVPVLALAITGAIYLINHPANPDYDQILYPIVIGMYVSTIPFYMAIYQAFKLLNYIDRNKAFSQVSVAALTKIKYSSIMFSAIYVVILPFVYMVAELDDAPGLIIIGGIPVFASLVIAVFAAVLQRLLQEAIHIKSENDLTV